MSSEDIWPPPPSITCTVNHNQLNTVIYYIWGREMCIDLLTSPLGIGLKRSTLSRLWFNNLKMFILQFRMQVRNRLCLSFHKHGFKRPPPPPPAWQIPGTPLPGTWWRTRPGGSTPPPRAPPGTPTLSLRSQGRVGPAEITTPTTFRSVSAITLSALRKELNLSYKLDKISTTTHGYLKSI